MKREVNMRTDVKDKEKTWKKDSNTKNTTCDNIITDPFGSWTGTDITNQYEKPVQDVDDL